jgi:glutamine amidotransferase-like uncharacterized protein
MMTALSPHYNFKIFTRHTLEDTFFDNVDMVAFPGGMGDSETYKYLLKINADPIRNYMARGGRYLGICMGAYWAGSTYLNILKDVDAVQYITQPDSDTRRPHAKSLGVTWNGQPESMYFYDGCAFVGNGKYDTVATYANGDPMAIMQDRMGLIGCHPESEAFWYTQYSWLKGKYHNGHHHTLLLEFTDQLMRR